MGAPTSSSVGGAQDPATAASLANAAAGIATGAALGGPVGAGIAAIGTTLSFIQASKQMQLQRQAEQDAAKALEEAKKQININPFAALGIQKEPYELEREALLAQGAQAIAAGQESDRGAAATAGRIYAGQIAEQQGQRAAMGKDLMNLEQQTAEEQQNIKTQLANVALKETEGYQKQAAEAAKARAQAIQQGYQSGAKALEYGLTELPTILARGGNEDTGYKGVASYPSAVSGPSGNQQVPSSKLNTSSFQTMPSWQSLAQQQAFNNQNFGEGSKLGPGIKTPNWSDYYNYFKPF